MPDVAEPVAAGHLGLDRSPGARARPAGPRRGWRPGGRRRRCRRRTAPGRASSTARSAARLARATSATCTKSRTWPPSSKTWGGSPALERGAEHRRDAGVRRVAGHPRRRRRCGSAARPPRQRRLAHPRRGVVLLGDLAGGVGRARLEPRVLVDQGPAERAAAVGAVVLEVARLERLDRARRRGLVAVLGARVAPLAVDDHRRGEDQPVHVGVVHGREQRGGAEVVVAGVVGEVGDADPGADHGRLVAHRVDAVEQRRPRAGVAHVEPVGARPAGSLPPCAIGSITSTRTTSYPSDSSTPATAVPMKPAEPVSNTLTAPPSPRPGKVGGVVVEVHVPATLAQARSGRGRRLPARPRSPAASPSAPRLTSLGRDGSEPRPPSLRR